MASSTTHLFRASDHANDSKSHLLLACSGSVATIKLPQILSSLSAHPSLSIRVILTPSASKFLAGQSAEQPHLSALVSIRNVDAIYQDEDEWSPAWMRGAPVLHIELRRWADILVVAPLSANTMAKVVAGMSDSLLLSVLRVWDTSGMVEGRESPKRVVVCPAMNTAMWRHPVTRGQLAVLEGEWGVENGGWVEVLRPVEKELACGDVGDGAMREWREVVEVIEQRLGLKKEKAAVE
jgi:phosphopantothenoylcysteine decarboxylase